MEQWDQLLFQFINSSMSNPVFDWLMPRVTDLHKISWVRFIVAPLLILLWYRRYGIRMIPLFLSLLLCVGFTDAFTYRVLKPHFQRPRPPAVESQIKLRTDRYAGFGFPSNHAANNFAAASFLGLCYPALTGSYFLFALLIAFSRVYVGVHYPADVFFGGLLGFVLGLFFFKICMIIIKRFPKRWQHHPTLD